MTSANQTRVHFRNCNLCEAMCGIAIELMGDEIVGIRGDVEDGFSRGHICPKAVALQDVWRDPDRLKHPLRRVGDRWEEVGWDEALDEVVARLVEIQDAHGRDAVAIYQGNPTVHNSGTMLFAPHFWRALRTRHHYSASSVDQLPHHVAGYFMFGHQLVLPVPDVDRTDHMLILGANPMASNGSLMTAPGMRERLRAVQTRGGRVVLVDPRYTETARIADEHHFIRPGTDVLLLLAILHTIFSEDLVAPGSLPLRDGDVERIGGLVRDFPPERVASLTGMAADAIRSMATAFASAPSAVCYGRVGVSTQAFGSACQWLINVLNALTGNLDRPGGAMFPTPAIDTTKSFRPGSYGRWRSRVRGAPEFSGEFPVAILAEEILTPGEGRVRALITSAGNPVLSTPDGATVDRALTELDFMVSIDIYLNETTRHADFILPPAWGIETDHYDLAFHGLAVRDTAKYSPPLFEPEAGALRDWEIFRGLRRRLEAAPGRGARSMKARLGRAFTNRLTPRRMLDLGLRLGPYGAWGGRFLRSGALSLTALERAPHGIDLGPLKTVLPDRLWTDDKKVHLAPDLLVKDLDRVTERFFSAGADGGDSADGFDLLLIGRRQLRSNNSWMHNTERLVKGRDRCTAMMHPTDATARGLSEGDAVRVRSAIGSVELPLEVTDEILAGVISIPHGWGHARPGIRLGTASAHPGVSINDLTDAARVDAVSGNAAFSAVPVSVTAGRASLDASTNGDLLAHEIPGNQ
jgi:anaerobic selenocysteine-containing dehydrogenase